MALPVKWTKERPTKAGFYWWRGEKEWYAGIDDHPPPIILCVSRTVAEMELEVAHPFMDYFDSLDDWNGEWLGPLSPPD